MTSMPDAGSSTATISRRIAKIRNYIARSWPLYAMFAPGLVALAIFSYYPMYGVVMAFQDYNPGLGFIKSPWVGLENFRSIFSNPDFYNILRNTFIIATTKIVTLQFAAVVLALLLNEVVVMWLKRWLQTILYLPYFLSWIVLGGILLDMLSSRGVVAQTFRALGLESPMFLGSNKWFVPTLIITNIWQSVGWSTIIYLAALTAVDPQLHEAAAIDGANRWQRVRHVTLPGIASTVALLACLNLGNVLQAGFDQIFTLYNPAVYATGDILDTYVYRVGLISARYSLGAAIGLLKSVMGFILIVTAYRLAAKFTDYNIF